jgi:hypothetical protein
MIQTSGSVSEGRFDVVYFEVRQLFQHLLRAETCRQQVQHVNDADAHTAYARAAAALLGINRDSLHQVRHAAPLPGIAEKHSFRLAPRDSE